MKRTSVKGVKDGLSYRVTAVLSLAASVIGLVSFPFVFDAFGPRDNPFDKPEELGWIALLAAIAAACLLAGVYVRRLALSLMRTQ